MEIASQLSMQFMININNILNKTKDHISTDVIMCLQSLVMKVIVMSDEQINLHRNSINVHLTTKSANFLNGVHLMKISNPS